MSRGSILVIPACEPGRGGGHLIRCMALVRGLRTLDRDAWFLLPANNGADKLIDSTEFNRNWLIAENGIPDISWECIILDRFQTPPEELSRWTSLAPIIGIDEGGLVRNQFDFLIDILPSCNPIKANIADPSLLPLPSTRKQKEQSEFNPLKVLVSFGQEDTAGLGPAVAEALTNRLQKTKNTGMDITFLYGGLFTNHYSLTTTHYLLTNHYPLTTNLSEHLHEYDLIITHYGLTAFESLYAGVPVILLSPGAYHEKLAKAAGFYSAGVGKGRAAKLARLLLLAKGVINRTFLENLKTRCATLAAQYGLNHPPRQSLAELINGFTPDLSRNCPVCGSALQVPVLARFAERSYRRCKQCGIISMNRLDPPPIAYQREYFFESYQKQYGLSYLEDFPNLTAMGKRRLAIIKSLLPDNTANTPLLDIGCAYGPFLAAAKEEGFSPQGIDPSEDAIRYVTQNLNIPAVQGFFPDCSSLPTTHYPLFTTISLWYVIEHFRDCVPVLAEIQKLLKPGGVLAFATPSFSGVSGRFSLWRFLEHSPADHWTIWSPAVCKKALKNTGFQVKKIVNSGHHPERFPLLGKYAESRKSPLYWVLLAVSKIFTLGDTFEVYAVKKQEQTK